MEGAVGVEGPVLGLLPVVAAGFLGNGPLAVRADHDRGVGRAVAVGVGERVRGAILAGDHGGVGLAVVVGVVLGLARVEPAVRGVHGDVLAVAAGAARVRAG